MALTPEDLARHRFRRTLRGYAPAEVDDLLDRLGAQLRRTDAQVEELRSRVREVETRLAGALEDEAAVKQALSTGRHAAERSLQDAREQADELRAAVEREVTDQLDQAGRQAMAVLDEAREQRAVELARLRDLRELTERHRATLQAHLDQQGRRLAELDEQLRLPPDVAEELDRARVASPGRRAVGGPAAGVGPVVAPSAEPRGPQLRVRVHGLDDGDADAGTSGDSLG